MAPEELQLETGFKPDFRYEQVQFFFRKHWSYFLRIILSGLFIGLLLLVVIAGLYGLAKVFNFISVRFFLFFVGQIGVFLYLTLFFLEIFSYYFDIVIVTDHRIILVRKTIFLKNDSGALDLTKIQDLAVESRGIIQNYMRYGNIIITLSTPTPPIVLECAPRPHEYLERANRVKRENILKRQERRTRPVSPEMPEEPRYLQDIHSLLKGY